MAQRGGEPGVIENRKPESDAINTGNDPESSFELKLARAHFDRDQIVRKMSARFFRG